MVKRILALAIAAYVPTIAIMFVGCEDEYAPRITGVDPSLRYDTSYRTKYYRPQTSAPAYKNYIKIEKPKAVPPQSSNPWIPPARVEKSWKAIVIHHSATDVGNMASIDDYHRNNNGWDGIGYDFVIGNGSGSSNGEVETTFRWTQQKTGAHCKTDASNWANENAVGICLIGNFNKTRPTSRQMASLIKLTKFLTQRYDIPVSRVYGHSTTPGHSTKTDCPGKNFPMSVLKSNL